VIFSSAFRARVTFSRMSEAFLVQMKRFGILVVLIDVGVESHRRGRDGWEHAPSDRVVREIAEESFDHVQPRSARRCDSSSTVSNEPKIEKFNADGAFRVGRAWKGDVL